MDYFFDSTKMPNQDAGGDYSTANGPFVKGKKIIFGKFTIPSGTRAETHSHPNEQFIFPLQGKARMTIKGKKKDGYSWRYCFYSSKHSTQFCSSWK